MNASCCVHCNAMVAMLNSGHVIYSSGEYVYPLKRVPRGTPTMYLLPRMAGFFGSPTRSRIIHDIDKLILCRGLGSLLQLRERGARRVHFNFRRTSRIAYDGASPSASDKHIIWLSTLAHSS